MAVNLSPVQDRTARLRIDHKISALRVRASAMHVLALLRKANFNPDQPRAPRGNPDGGQWVRVDGGHGGRYGDGEDLPSHDYATILAGLETPPTPEKPEIPDKRPPTSRQRSAIARQVATYLRRAGTLIVRQHPALRALLVTHWFYRVVPIVQSYLDDPRTLQELQDRVPLRLNGYDVHHIVEQSGARSDGYSEAMIQGRANKVLIPRMRHWEINRWYQKQNEAFDGLTPRQYLRGKSWDERYRTGLDALRIHGVLK